jgi:H/ACA ribonucleoprotein complex subunit 3
MAKILKCKKCAIYTMESTCPKCKAETVTAEPAKFSPKDPYGEYRRKYKKLAAE